MKLLNSIHQFDIRTFQWCLRRKYRQQIIGVSRVISYSANGPFYAIAGVAFWFMEEWNLVSLLAWGFMAERLAYFFAKSTFKRNRPPEAIPGYSSVIKPSDQFSFPSGHTSAAFLVSTSVCFIYPSVGLLLFPWACLVAASRVMLGVHFPSDVMAGAVLGTSFCFTLAQILL